MNWNCLCPGCMQEKPEGYSRCPMCGFDVTTTNNEIGLLPIWTLLNNTYYIGKSLGAGGFGVTYVAFDVNLQKKLCIKEFFMEDYCYRVQGNNNVYTNDQNAYIKFQEHKQKFVQEAQILAKLDELPGVVRVLNYFEENQTAYIVMDFVEGQPLDDFVEARGGKLDPEYAFSLLQPVVNSLTVIHDLGIVHRDISPDNIMVTKEGRLKLIDFGAAKGKENRNEDKVIKKFYSPPEQCTWQGEIGTYSDVYALCATFYKIITGVKAQFSADRMQMDCLKPPSFFGVQIDPVKEDIIMNGLKLDIDQRIKNAKDLNYLLYGYARRQGASTEGVQKQIHDSSTKVIMNKIEKEQKKRKNRTITVVACIIIALLGCMIIAVNKIGQMRGENQTKEEQNNRDDETSSSQSVNVVNIDSNSDSIEQRIENAELAKTNFLMYVNNDRENSGANSISYSDALDEAAFAFAEQLASENHTNADEWNQAIADEYTVIANNYSAVNGAGWLEIPYSVSVTGMVLHDDIVGGIESVNASSNLENTIDLTNCNNIGLGYGIHEDGSVFWVIFYK